MMKASAKWYASFAIGLILGGLVGFGIAQAFRTKQVHTNEFGYEGHSGKFGLALKGSRESSSELLLSLSKYCVVDVESGAQKNCDKLTEAYAKIDAENGGTGGATALFQIYSVQDDCQYMLRALFWYSKFPDDLKRHYDQDYRALGARIARSGC